jgi:hypothetical protein
VQAAAALSHVSKRPTVGTTPAIAVNSLIQLPIRSELFSHAAWTHCNFWKL